MSDGSKLSKSLEEKWFGVLPTDAPQHVLGETDALAHGKLGRLRTRSATAIRQWNSGAVTSSPNVVKVFNLEIFVGDEAIPIVRDVIIIAKASDDPVGSVANRGDHGGGLDFIATLKIDLG